jgi:hypothetical protein
MFGMEFVHGGCLCHIDTLLVRLQGIRIADHSHHPVAKQLTDRMMLQIADIKSTLYKMKSSVGKSGLSIQFKAEASLHILDAMIEHMPQQTSSEKCVE